MLLKNFKIKLFDKSEKAMAIQPIILDFDQSVLPIEHEIRLDFSAYQEQLRFGASKAQFNHFKKSILLPKLQHLQSLLPFQADNAEFQKTSILTSKLPVFFLGSGDFHHFTLALLPLYQRYLAKGKKIQLIVLDNHPDNMRYLFGIHCGSWVSFAARLPFISQIHVVGITSSDIAFSHLWENRLMPLYSGKLTYWCKGIKTKWIDRIGLKKAYRSFATIEELIETFIADQQTKQDPIYLSIDKDVLSTKVIQTNWDQGDLTKELFFKLLSALKSRLFGVDITGELSVYHYQSRLKRFLSQLDEQPQFELNSEIELESKVKSDQKNQHQLNLAILDFLNHDR